MEQMRTRTSVLDRQIEKFDDYTDIECASPKDLGSLVSTKKAQTSAQINVRYNALGVVRVVVLASIIALLGFLLIYNIVAMSQVRNNIAVAETMIASEQAEVSLLIERLNALDSEAVLKDKALSAGYSANGGTIVTANTTLPTAGAITYDAQTNWFDRFCEFISSIFGG